MMKNRNRIGLALAMATIWSVESPASEIEVAAGKAGITVTSGGKPFTTIHTSGYARPVLYPLITAAGTRLNREFPFKKEVAGESADHPHHESLWFAHGDVNGYDFWKTGEGAGTIEVKNSVVSDDTVTLENQWNTPDGEPLLSDKTEIRFGAEGKLRWIDYTVTLAASFGELNFGDTKEGTMAVRTHPALRTKPPAGGTAVNSSGDRGGDLWGKKAAWVAYSGEPGSIAILDHPKNLRYPTTWHARDYGLVAANPFGIHDFENKPAGSGDFTLADGDSFTLRYRFLLSPEAADLDEIARSAEAFSQ